METLTDELATAAQEILDEVEALGGMAKAVESGMPKLRIEESAARKQARIDSGLETIVGMNKYKVPAGEDEGVDVLSIDNAQVRQEQCEALVAIRASRDSVAATAALDALTASAALETSTGPGDHPQNLLRLAVAAARARCSVGEISDALEAKWGRYAVTSSVVQGELLIFFAVTYNMVSCESSPAHNCFRHFDTLAPANICCRARRVCRYGERERQLGHGVQGDAGSDRRVCNGCGPTPAHPSRKDGAGWTRPREQGNREWIR